MLQREVRHVPGVVHEVVRVLAQDGEGPSVARDPHRLLVGLDRRRGDDDFAAEHFGEDIGRLQTGERHLAVGEFRITHGLQ